MEKHLEWVHKLNGAESLPRVGQTVLARLLESQVWHPPVSFVALCREGQNRGNGLCLPWCSTLQFLPIYHWCLSSCYPSAGAQKESIWVGDSVCGFFKRNCLGFQNVLSLIQSLLGFAARSCGDLPSWHWNPGLLGLVWWGWDSLLPSIPPEFLSTTCGCGTNPLHISILPTCLNGFGFFNSVAVRLPFTQFLTVLSDGCSIS